MPNTIIERKIGDVVMDVTVEEKHEDTLTITDHPVERGAAISDHAYKNPVWVTITAGKGARGGDSVPRETYEALIELQQSREPFNIITGKREYENMLVQSVSVTTDPDTENILAVILDCREVIIVETDTTQVPASRQRQAAKTQKAQNAGTKQAQDEEQVKRSTLDNLIGGLIGGRAGS